MAKKYIPANCWLTCDKGQTPTQITVTHDNNTCIYGERLVSEADMMPGENIQPFGNCSIKGSCSFMPVYWDKCNQNVKVNGFKLVFEDANLICKHGGKIKADFTIPTAVSGGTMGLGFGLDQLGSLTSNLKGLDAMMPLDQIRWSQNDAGKYFRNTFPRNIFFENGKPVSTLRDAIIRNGGTTYGKVPPLEVVKMSDGGYTSLDHRRGVAALEAGSKNAPVTIRDGKAPLPPDELGRYKLNSDGAKRLGLPKNTTATTYEEAVKFRSANQGKKFPLEGNTQPPKVRGGGMAAPSKASQAIGKISQSISNSKFSQAIQASPKTIAANAFLAKHASKISTVGKVAGRGLVVLGIAFESYNVYATYKAEGEFGTETKQALGGATGAIAGGLAGGKGGAMLGAFIGTCICPGIGTAIGGVVGGVLGGIGGALAGSSLGKWVGSWF